MSNIKVSAAVTALVTAVAVAGAITVSVSPNTYAVSAQPENIIRLSVFVVPMKSLEEQTVAMSDFRQIEAGKAVIEIATATDDVAISVNTLFTDSVTMTDAVNRMFYGNIDFDPTDPDADPDPIVMADVDAKDVGKIFTDTATAADAVAQAPGKVLTDSTTATDAVNTIAVDKSVADTATITDTSPVFNAAKVVADSASATDAAALNVDRGNIADTVTATDSATSQPDLAKTDTITASDTLNNFSIGVNPSDAATVTDAVNTFAVNKVLTDTVEMTDFIAKTPGYEFDFDVVDADADPDPVTMGDVMAKSLTRPNITDTISATDVLDLFAVNKVLTDSITMADVVSLILILGQSSPLYDFAFMSDDKFTYFPVPGVLNAHLIHEPLVNGEFVLTTDPNAGIVYTIRTESYSYMFAGYGLNENQLN